MPDPAPSPFSLPPEVLAQATFGSTGFLCVVTDPQGVIRTFNAGAERLLGYRAAELVDRWNLTELADPQTWAGLAQTLGEDGANPAAPGFERLAALAARDFPDGFEAICLRKTGPPLPLLVSLSALRDGQGALLGYLVVGTDNRPRKKIEAHLAQARSSVRQANRTIRKQNKLLEQRLREATEHLGESQELQARMALNTEALREREAHLRAIIETSPDAMVIYDEEGRITELNPAAEAMFGWTRDRALGQELAELMIPADDGGSRRQLFREALARGESRYEGRRGEVHVLHAEGHRVPAELTTRVVRGKDSRRCIAFLRDLTESKAAAAQLAASEAWHRTLFESSRDALMTLAPPTWAFTACNPATLAMFGMAREADFLAMGPWDLSPELQADGRRTLDKAPELIEAALREGSLAFEWTHRRMDGTCFPASVLLTRVDLGDRTFLQATVRDLSAQKAAEAEARAATEQFELIVRTVDDVFWIGAADLEQTLFVSEACRRVWHRSPQEFIEQPHLFDEALHPEDRDRVVAFLLEAQREGRIVDQEYRIRWPDGTVRWIRDRGYPLVDAEGKVTRYVGMARDITSQKEAEAQVGALRRRQEDLLASLGVGVHGLDAGGNIIFENAAALAMFGSDMAAMLGQNAHGRIHHHRADGSPYPQVDCPIYVTLRDGVRRQVEDEVFWRKDGTSFPVSYTVTPLRGEGGSPQGAVVVFSDVTERKRQEETQRAYLGEIALKNLALERANRAKAEFLATVTHELRTPLHSVIGFADLLNEGLGGPLTPKQLEYTAHIQAGGHRLLSLVNGILAYTEAQEPGLAPASVAVDLQEVLEASLEDGRAAAAARDLRLQVEVKGDLGAVRLEPRWLKQVLAPLLDNAIKFNRQGGQVTLSARRDGTWLELAVADTGIGIAPEDLTRLAVPFVQLDTGPARQYGGVGLGLSLARRLVESLGGTLKVESALGKGTCVTLRIPTEDGHD